MPLNKNASFRYRLIDECLCNRSTKWTMVSLQRYVSEKLLEHFDVETNEDGLAVSLRSLKGDIAIMRKDPPLGYAAPIICRRGECFTTILLLPYTSTPSMGKISGRSTKPRCY